MTVPVIYHRSRVVAGYPWLAELADAKPGEFTFLDEHAKPLRTIQNVLSYRGFQRGAIAVEHQHPEIADRKVLIVYNQRGQVVTPPLDDYRFVRIANMNQTDYPNVHETEVCLLPVDAEESLYWPVAETGHPVPVPEGAIGIKLIEQKDNPHRHPIVGAAVLWDTPDGPRYAVISNLRQRFNHSATLAASRAGAKWTDFSAVDQPMFRPSIPYSTGTAAQSERIIRYEISRLDVLMVKDAEQSVFILPLNHPEPWDALETTLRNTPFRSWEDARSSLQSYNNRLSSQIRQNMEDQLKQQARDLEAHRQAQAQRRQAAEQARNREAHIKVMRAIRDGRLNMIGYDDMRYAYQAEQDPQVRKQIEDAFRSKEAIEKKAAEEARRQAASTLRFNYSPYGVGGSQSIQSSWQRQSAQQAQTHWNNQLRNYERDRSFDAVRRAAGYAPRN